MTLIAVLSDLHANLSALHAVADDLARRRPEAVLVLGDLVGYLTRPNQVVAFVERAGWPCLAGNYDQAVLAGGDQGVNKFLKPGIGADPKAIFAWTEKAVDRRCQAYLASRPAHLRLEIEGSPVLGVHGSPEQVRQYVYPDHPQAEMNGWLAAHRARVLLMGHTHLPFVRELAGGLAVNPGSVGKPKDGDPRASYALVETGPRPRARVLRVDYDLEEEARRLLEAGLPPSAVEKLRRGL